MELKEAKVFYEIFKSTGSDWVSYITNPEIKTILGDDYTLEEIALIKEALSKDGTITIDKNSIKVNYTNSRLY